MFGMSDENSVAEATVKTCRRGHPMTPDNLWSNGRGRPPSCKICRKASAKAWQLANPEYVSEGHYRAVLAERKELGIVKPQGGPAAKTHCPQGHEYTEENTYRCGENSKSRQCRICRRQRSLESYQRHREKRHADRRAKYAANPEAFLKYSRRWQQENRERSNLLGRIKKQRRRNAGTLTVADWELVLDVYGHACLACGKPEVTIDHVVPVSCGGPNDISNVQPLCGFCNTSKGTKTIDYRPEPWADVAQRAA
jgi:5-methylcytosine-specific restriction endonuclease McrA